MNYNNNFSKPEWYSDYLLVQEILDGNVHVWDILYRNTYPVVYNYLKRTYIRWNISPDQIEDITGEAFKRCFCKLDSYMGKSKFSTWVCGFCRYIILEHNHKYSLYNKYAYELYRSTQLSSFCLNPENIIIKKERDICLWDAFNSLTLHHQLLLQCYVLHELKPSQINKVIKKSHSANKRDEINVATRTLRNRFLALYENRI